jgi:hypothetical protein
LTPPPKQNNATQEISDNIKEKKLSMEIEDEMKGRLKENLEKTKSEQKHLLVTENAHVIEEKNSNQKHIQILKRFVQRITSKLGKHNSQIVMKCPDEILTKKEETEYSDQTIKAKMKIFSSEEAAQDEDNGWTIRENKEMEGENLENLEQEKIKSEEVEINANQSPKHKLTHSILLNRFLYLIFCKLKEAKPCKLKEQNIVTREIRYSEPSIKRKMKQFSSEEAAQEDLINSKDKNDADTRTKILTVREIEINMSQSSFKRSPAYTILFNRFLYRILYKLKEIKPPKLKEQVCEEDIVLNETRYLEQSIKTKMKPFSSEEAAQENVIISKDKNDADIKTKILIVEEQEQTLFAKVVDMLFFRSSKILSGHVGFTIITERSPVNCLRVRMEIENFDHKILIASNQNDSPDRHQRLFRYTFLLSLKNLKCVPTLLE